MINWTAVGVVCSVIVAVVGASTAYLRLFTSNQMQMLKDEVLEHTSKTYMRKDLAILLFQRKGNSKSPTGDPEIDGAIQR